MKKAIFLFFRYYLFWMVFFLFFRGLFLLANLSLSQTLSVEELFGTFRHGCVMDCSAAAYFSLLPGLLIAVSTFFPRISRPFIKYYTLLLLILVTLLGLADIALYPAWGTRIDAQILPYLKEPDAIFSSITLGQIALALASLAIIVALFFSFFFVSFSIHILLNRTCHGRPSPSCFCSRPFSFSLFAEELILPRLTSPRCSSARRLLPTTPHTIIFGHSCMP